MQRIRHRPAYDTSLCLGGGTLKLPARRNWTQIGEHDHAREWASQPKQRLTTIGDQSSMQDRKHRTNSTLRHHSVSPHQRLCFSATLIDNPVQYAKHTCATLQCPRTGRQRLNDQQTSKRRIPIQTIKQREKTSTNPLNPPRARLIRGDHNARDPLNTLIERGKKTLFAISEQFIERAPRHTRASNNMRDGHIPNTVLCDLNDHRREDPPALDPHKTIHTQTILAGTHHDAHPDPSISGGHDYNTPISFFALALFFVLLFLLAFLTFGQPVALIGVF